MIGSLGGARSRSIACTILLAILTSGCMSAGLDASSSPQSIPVASIGEADASAPVQLVGGSRLRPLSFVGSATAPEGFQGVCGRYPWACSSQDGQVSSQKALVSLARSVNSSVNRAIQPATDRDLYGVDDYWTVPTTAGDCEDYALLKKKRLHEAGVPGNRLMLATAFTPRLEHHVVLIVRSDEGDLVLDNLSGAVKPWQATGYTFLKMQDPASKGQWRSILLGPNSRRPST